MDEHEALVEAILDAPEDEARRLVYADWLEEHGSFADGVRARLTRLQVRRARAEYRSAEAEGLDGQIKALRGRYSWLILPPVPPGFENPRLDRGIVWINVSLAVPRFIEWGEDYLRGLPPYCRFSLRVNRPPARGKMASLLDGPAWPRVAGLWLRKPYRFGEQEAVSFLTDPRLRRLDTLSLRRANIGDTAVARLAASPHLTRLVDLELPGNPIGDAGLEALASGPGLPRLTQLGVSRGTVSEEAVRAFKKKRPSVELYFDG